MNRSILPEDFQRRLPWVSLGLTTPTPLERVDWLGRRLGLNEFLLKRDDQTHPWLGGNKARKLEFVLGDALHDGVRTLVTSGGVSSNHVLATSYFGRRYGLTTAALLAPQPDNPDRERYQHAHVLLETRLLDASLAGAGRAAQVLPRLCCDDTRWVPAGGSSTRGMMGYVTAALELGDQLQAGDFDPPDAIVVAGGSMGTAAGLAVGCGLVPQLRRTEILTIATVPWPIASQRRLDALIRQQAAAVRTTMGASVQPVTTQCIHGFVGRGYGYPTDDGHRATLFMAHGNLELDAVYTAKAAAGLVALASGRLRGRNVLFWHTKHHWPDLLTTVSGHRGEA